MWRFEDNRRMPVLAVVSGNRRPDVAAITSGIDMISRVSWSLSG